MARLRKRARATIELRLLITRLRRGDGVASILRWIELPLPGCFRMCAQYRRAIEWVTALGSLIPGLGVWLSMIILAGLTVLSAVGACPPHDGVRRRWRINVESAVVLSGARKESNDLTTATVPAGTTFPAVSREPYDLLMRATRQPSSSTS
jgi:hypothetical protein